MKQRKRRIGIKNAALLGCAALCALGWAAPARAEMAQESLSSGRSSLEGKADSAQGEDLSGPARDDSEALVGPTATPSPTPRADCGVIGTVAGDSVAAYEGDQGPASSAQFNAPMGLCFDARGDLYIADRGNNVIREVDARSGLIKTVAGNGTAGFDGDQGEAIYAELDAPSGVCVDAQGALYISDTLNNRIRKVDPSGLISTLAGDGLPGYNGDQGPALSAALNAPQGICLDGSGNVYFAEAANHAVRKLDLSGVISTVAGNGTAGDDGDGGAAISAHLQTPVDVCADDRGGLYIADPGAASVRKIDAYGNISTLAGDGTAGYQGDGGAAVNARLQRPFGLAWAASALYIADAGSHVIRKIDSGGAISTLAGNGSPGWDGDQSPAIQAELNAPEGLAVAPDGDLYLSDMAENVIRKLNCH